jgi:hypothetical protein
MIFLRHPVPPQNALPAPKNKSSDKYRVALVKRIPGLVHMIEPQQIIFFAGNIEENIVLWNLNISKQARQGSRYHSSLTIF